MYACSIAMTYPDIPEESRYVIEMPVESLYIYIGIYFIIGYMKMLF